MEFHRNCLQLAITVAERYILNDFNLLKQRLSSIYCNMQLKASKTDRLLRVSQLLFSLFWRLSSDISDSN